MYIHPARLFRRAVVLVVLLAVPGCASLNRTERGAATGAAIGGILGGLLDDHTARGAIIGAAVGGTAGAIIGRQMDRQAAELDAELANATVERVGEGIQVTFASGLLFDFDSDALRSGSRTDLSDLASSLQEYDNTELLVIGHTDSQGADSYNLDLSRRRAAAAANHVTSQGVRRARIDTEGRGESEPVANNESEAGRQENRRVEIAIFASEAYRQSLMDRGETSEPASSDWARRLSFEVRGGLNGALGAFRDAGARGNAAFAGDVIFDLTPALALYGGWGRDQFSCEVCEPGEGIDAQGFEAGAQYSLATAGSLTPWIRAGATLQKAEAEIGSFTATSSRKLGFQISGGVEFPLGDIVSVAPGLRYQRFSPEMDFDGNGGVDGALSSMSADVAVRIRPSR